METTPLTRQIAAVRTFNRFYTRHIGLLDEGLLDSPHSLTEARVLFELARSRETTAKELCDLLGIDAGYMSRILQKFATRRLVTRKRSAADARRVVLTLTRSGRAAFASLDSRSEDAIRELLAPLGAAGRRSLVASLREVQRALAAPESPRPSRIVLRAHRPGDIGWAIARHGELYAEEYGWNVEFEALVATLFGDFVAKHDPRTERLWIAEVNGERAGSVFVTHNARESAAQLRCLLVDPAARGHGVGRRLVRQCITFAREAGHSRIMLWTNDVLVAARRLYESEGFTLTNEERHHSFGKALIGQTWSLQL